MISLSSRQYGLVSIIILAFIPYLVFGKSVAVHKKGQQRSYIDIDVTDPFKVPKTSEYVDQPIPRYDGNGNRKSDENDHSINYKFDNVKVQTENKVDVDDGVNHNEDEHDRYDDPGPDGHHFHDEMPEDGPEIQADQEESPRDLEPEPYHSHDEDEHMPGDSRHNVPKADWKQDDIEPISNQRGHEDSGAPWRNDESPPNEDFRRHDYGERKFEQSEEDRDNDSHENENEHYGGWERRGEDHERDDMQHFGPHEGSHAGSHDEPHDLPHEEPQERSREGPHDWGHDGAREEQRGEGPEDNPGDNGREGEYYDRESQND